MDIKFNDLSKQWEVIKKEAIIKLDELFIKSDYIVGKAVPKFEKNFAKYIGTKYAIGVSNGTDALKISLAALNLESPCGVIIPANTYIATALAITYLCDVKHDLVLIDCDEYYQIDPILLEEYLEKHRKEWKSCVIIPVHLYGHPCDIEQIIKIARTYNCFVLEDSSQSHGALVNNKKVGSFGDISAFSLYPGKNLGACGDAGIITTNNSEYYEKAMSLRNFGSSKKYYYDYRGWNNRLDTIQAIFLNEKLKYLDQWNDARVGIAEKYSLLIKNKNIVLPKSAKYVDKHVYHIYALRIKNRDVFEKYLNSNNIPTVIHYPIPIQKTTPFQYLNENNNNKNAVNFANELISLPMHPFLENDKIEYIIKIINEFQ